MLDVQISRNPALHRLLERHPRVSSVSESEGAPLRWVQDGHWHRRIWVGRADIELKGLVELMDNNPLVCADEMSVPSAAGTLALIALGPLARAGLIQELFTIDVNFDADLQDVHRSLVAAGWQGDTILTCCPRGPYEVCDGSAMMAIEPATTESEVNELYEEAYGRSFFVRRNNGAVPDQNRVKDQPFATYSIRFAENEDEANELAIQVVSDREGKCGAGQIVHAFNVMAGFEESLGL